MNYFSRDLMRTGLENDILFTIISLTYFVVGKPCVCVFLNSTLRSCGVSAYFSHLE